VGWYPDPSGAPGQRYYDGEQWTEHHALSVSPGAQADATRLVIVLSVVAVVLASAVLSPILGAVH
jgi:hypothetical protein